jgi:hypothetical protein
MKKFNPSTVVINLHKISAGTRAAAAADTGRRVLFVSAVHPRLLLGPLWEEDGFEGAWMENFRILARLGGTTRVFEAPGVISDDPTRLAKWVLENLLAGHTPAAIQDALDRSTAKTWALVA